MTKDGAVTDLDSLERVIIEPTEWSLMEAYHGLGHKEKLALKEFIVALQSRQTFVD